MLVKSERLINKESLFRTVESRKIFASKSWLETEMLKIWFTFIPWNILYFRVTSLWLVFLAQICPLMHSCTTIQAYICILWLFISCVVKILTLWIFFHKFFRRKIAICMGLQNVIIITCFIEHEMRLFQVIEN